MGWCWQQNPRLRPSFIQILESIKDDMSASFHKHAFFYSKENRRHSSWETSEAETDQLLEAEAEERLCLPPPPRSSPLLALGLRRDPEDRPTNCCHANGKPRL